MAARDEQIRELRKELEVTKDQVNELEQTPAPPCEWHFRGRSQQSTDEIGHHQQENELMAEIRRLLEDVKHLERAQTTLKEVFGQRLECAS